MLNKDETKFSIGEIKEGCSDLWNNVDCMTCSRLLGYIKDLLPNQEEYYILVNNSFPEIGPEYLQVNDRNGTLVVAPTIYDATKFHTRQNVIEFLTETKQANLNLLIKKITLTIE